MQIVVGVAELKAKLSQWLTRATEGEEVIITDHGVPVARITGVRACQEPVVLERLAFVRQPVSPGLDEGFWTSLRSAGEER